MTEDSAPTRRPHASSVQHVEVTGVGRAAAVPDVVRLDLGVRVDASGVAAALAGAAEKVSGVAAAARQRGVDERDLATTGAAVQPRWDREGQAIVGYTAHHRLSLRVRRTGELTGLVDAVADVAGDALVIDGIALDVADPAPLHAQARAAAFADAHARAGQYAALAGAQLGRVLEVSETEAGFGTPAPAARIAYAAAESAGLPVAAGEHTVTAAVRVTWELLA